MFLGPHCVPLRQGPLLYLVLGQSSGFKPRGLLTVSCSINAALAGSQACIVNPNLGQLPQGKLPSGSLLRSQGLAPLSMPAHSSYRTPFLCFNLGCSQTPEAAVFRPICYLEGLLTEGCCQRQACGRAQESRCP